MIKDLVNLIKAISHWQAKDESYLIMFRKLQVFYLKKVFNESTSISSWKQWRNDGFHDFLAQVTCKNRPESTSESSFASKVHDPARFSYVFGNPERIS